jgi:hypothetical protein
MATKASDPERKWLGKLARLNPATRRDQCRGKAPHKPLLLLCLAVQVVARYRFICALTGLCCLTAEGSTIVDAAHIEPWATSQNDDLTNGLALRKNAHWMFKWLGGRGGKGERVGCKPPGRRPALRRRAATGGRDCEVRWEVRRGWRRH